MTPTNFSKFSLLVTLAFFSCDSDDTSNSSSNTFTTPSTYTFLNETGESTVDFSGQTTRLLQANEILDALETFGTTEAALDEMYGGITTTENELASAGFENEELNGTTKVIRDKTADSDDYFGLNTTGQAVIRLVFDGYISSQVDTFLNAYPSIVDVPVAESGTAGILGERLVNEKGLEYKQAFNKGLIGAFTLDQIVNNYLTRCLVTSTQEANTAGTLDGDNNYTLLEHYWDEAYGYVYGNTTDDNFLYKYIETVEADQDFAGISENIETAYITGRAAIVANDYTTLEEQAVVLQELLSEVVAIKAVYYLQQAKADLSDNSTIEDGSAFHNLSQAYGFIYSLQFTRIPNTDGPYISAETVDGYMTGLEEGNGFWDLVDNTSLLDITSEAIAAEFNFTVAQAAE